MFSTLQNSAIFIHVQAARLFKIPKPGNYSVKCCNFQILIATFREVKMELFYSKICKKHGIRLKF